LTNSIARVATDGRVSGAAEPLERNR